MILSMMNTKLIAKLLSVASPEVRAKSLAQFAKAVQAEIVKHLQSLNVRQALVLI